jgi:hypothetical protein
VDRKSSLQSLWTFNGFLFFEWESSWELLEGWKLKSSKPVPIQEVIDAITENQQQVLDVKHQNIIYFMDNKIKKVSQKELVQIDFLKATSEMNGIDWAYEMNFIGFDNLSKKECVQFIRQGQDKWYVEVPILKNGKWKGYAWGSYSDSATVTNLLRLFFEEVAWFGMLSWKMRRFKH